MDRPEHFPAAPPAPRFAAGLASVVFAVATLALAYPALTGQFLVNPFSDQYIAGYAFREFAAQSLRDGQGFPLWSPYIFGGMPYVAAMHGDIFYPTFLLRIVLPTDVAMTWGFVIHVWLCGLFTYLFLRALGLSFFAALIGGLAFMLSGQIASLVSPGHDGKLFISALFPATLLLVLRGVRQGRRWAWGVLALVIGLAVLSPHPQLLQYLLLASGAFAVFCAFGTPDGSRMERRLAVRRLACALGAVVLGMGMGAVQYLPVREYVAWSPRAGGLRAYEAATSFSMPPEELINTFLPQFSGILAAYWGRNGIHFHSEYLGVGVLMLAALGFGARRERDDRRGLVWFWVATAVVALLWALGGFTPFYSLVYALVPGTKFFRAPSTIFFVVSFAVAVLAAFGAERAVAGKVTPRYLAGWIGAGLLVALLATTGVLRDLGLSIVGEERFEIAAANQRALVAGAWRSLLFVAVTAGLLLARRRGRLEARVTGWALSAIVTADLWTILRHYWMFSAPASQLFAPDAIIAYLRALPQPARVVALELADPQAVHDPYFNGDALWLHGIRTPGGYHGNELGRYQILGNKQQGYRNIYASSRFWQLMNVQYFLTNTPDLSIVEGATRVAGPVRNSAGSVAYLFRLPGENPVAWVAPVIVKASDEVVLATLSDPRFDDVRRAALFDTSATVMASPATRALPPVLPLTVTTTRFEPGHIGLRLSAPAPQGSALIVSENYYPGWKATSGGRELPLGRADFTLIGVELPRGATDVELTFHSPPYETGKLISLVALGASLLLAAVGLFTERRRRG